ncbi:IclR family transcriptional regulator [Gordonia soli]|uniref:IclR family transcriptional regulator n=1 Tax=Gordonia soli TaxID=320799 RepID=UPI00058AEC1A|nr:IclR family transcriptional regulator [Gordonia soli]
MSADPLPTGDVPAGMVDRVVLILDVFARSSGRLTLGQITARSRLPRSSVHRILQQLVTARWVSRDDNEYSLGLRVFEIGSQVGTRRRLTEAAAPHLHDLSRMTGHTVHLAVLDGHEVVYLEKISGGFGTRLPSRIGGRLPAHCTGVGKVLLAQSDPSVVDDYVAHALPRQTRASIHEPQALRDALDSIRGLGYATERSEAVPGVGCVAAAVIEYDEPIAAVSICGPQRLAGIPEMKHHVIRTAAQISRRLATPQRPRPTARPAVMVPGQLAQVLGPRS